MPIKTLFQTQPSRKFKSSSADNQALPLVTTLDRAALILAHSPERGRRRGWSAPTVPVLGTMGAQSIITPKDGEKKVNNRR